MTEFKTEGCGTASCSDGTCSSKKSSQKGLEVEEGVKNTLKGIKNKLMVMSGKGGVGKSSVTVNLGLALAKKGFKTGIMDVDIHGPDIPRMLGLTEMLDVNDSNKLNPLAYSENLVAVSMEALCVNKDDAIIWRGPMKFSAINQFIGHVEWGELDFLLIDSPPGTGDEPLTVAQIISDARALVVTTPQEIALADVRKSINFCKTVNMDIFGLIENMSGFTCPHCDEAVDIFGTGGGKKTAVDAGIDFLGGIPFDANVVKCGDAGTPFYEKYQDSVAGKAFSGIAEKLGKTV